MESVIFGSGAMARGLIKGLKKYYGAHICAVFDNDERKWGKKMDDVVISSPQKLMDIDFDKIFVCIWSKVDCNAVEMQLVSMGIPKEKIVLMASSIDYADALVEVDPVRKNWIKAFSGYTKEVGMLGSVAECGVYYGETAMFINRYWPDRTLHLFDTFEGFSDKDFAYDINTFHEIKGWSFSSANSFKGDTPDSIIEVVKNRMCYPDNLKIHKGHFPESAGIIEDRFCFVNLDMDLYQPQLEGLRYFWNKMVSGGVILLHDYYHPDLPGVKMAVTDFEKELGDMLLKFPIGDYSSIAILKR